MGQFWTPIILINGSLLHADSHKIEEKIRLLAERDESMRRFRQFFVGGAAVCEIEKNRELVMPEEYIDYAMLKQDVVILGIIDHFEIWSKEIHDKRLLLT